MVGACVNGGDAEPEHVAVEAEDEEREDLLRCSLKVHCLRALEWLALRDYGYLFTFRTWYCTKVTEPVGLKT